jgi:transposase InsO family protein
MDESLGNLSHTTLLDIQSKFKDTKPSGADAKDRFGLWRIRTTKGYRIWIPDGARRVKARIIAYAHSLGEAGHRGARDTATKVASTFWWKNMSEHVPEVLRRCGWCLKLSANAVVPRPLAATMHATAVGQYCHSDFYYVTAKSKYKYLVCVKDDLSRFLYIEPAKRATADAAAHVLNRYVANFHKVPEMWTTDGGSHFQNTTLKRMTTMMTTKHHITTPHAPWANGKVEAVFKGVRRQLIVLLQQTSTEEKDWHHLVPALQYALNNHTLVDLGGKAPAEVFLGRRPTTPFDVVLGDDGVLSRLANGPASPERVDALVLELRKQLEDAMTAVRTRRRPTSRASARPPQFRIGDLVLKGRVDKDARDKLRTNWAGPYRVVETVNEQSYMVKGLLDDDPEYRVHSSRLVFFGPKDMRLSDAVLAMLSHDDGGQSVKAILSHKSVGGQLEVMVQWLGFEGADLDAVTWEPVEALVVSARQALTKYLKGLPDSDTARVEIEDLLKTRPAAADCD